MGFLRSTSTNVPEFYADHPFVYHIWDSKTKTILFSGRIIELGSD